MLLRQIFDPYLAQYAYLVGCQRSGEALIIDPERDIDQYYSLAEENGLIITAVAETHIHADFVSGGQYFANNSMIHLYLSGEGGADWSYRWPGTRPNTHILRNGDCFTVGHIKIEVLHTPGHTPEHISFLITDVGSGATEPMALVSGDFLFVGDVGRPDLLESAAGVKNVMESSARTLQESLKVRLEPLADFMQILPAHGAGSACGKTLGAVPMTTLGYERRFNHALKLANTDCERFVTDILQGQPNPPLYFATMKRVNRDGVKEVTGRLPLGRHLSSESFSALFSEMSGDGVRDRKGASESDRDSAIQVLDVRMNREVYDAGHIARAIWAPLRSSFFSMAAGSFLTESNQIVLIVDHESDVDLAARQLYRIGLDGLIGWMTANEAEVAGLLTVQTKRIKFADFDPVRACSTGVIVDVRTTAEFEKSHLKGAYSMPYTRLKEHTQELPRGKTLFVHCASGKRASLATSFLVSEGFDAVHIDGIFGQCGAGNSGAGNSGAGL
jgi:hydroxyacylglutathione hydrolase